MAGLRRTGLWVATFGALMSGSASATVYTEDFTGETEGATPTSGSTSWYATGGVDAGVSIAASVGGPAPSLRLSDTSGSVGAVTELNFGVASFSPFDMNTPAQSVITIAFDLRVDEFQSANNSGSTVRLAIKDGNGTTSVPSDDRYVIVGLGQANVNDGASGGSNDLFLYAGGSTTNFLSTVVESNAIGLNAGSGWANGFDFGNFATMADADTNDQFYRIAVRLTAGSADVLVTATQLDALGAATANSTTKTITVPSILALSSVGTDGFGFYTGNGGRAVAYVDNTHVTAVPEPMSLGLLGGGVLLFTRRRRG